MINKDIKWKFSSLTTFGISSLVCWVWSVLLLFSITGNVLALDCTLGLGVTIDYSSDSITNVSGLSHQYCDTDTNCHSDITDGTQQCFGDPIHSCSAQYVTNGNNCPITDGGGDIGSTCWDRYSACTGTCANGISTFACSTNSCNCADASGIITYNPNLPDSNNATIQTVVDAVNSNHQASSNIANSMSEIKTLGQSSNATLVGIQNATTNSTGDIVSAIGGIQGGGAGGTGGEGGSITLDLNPTNSKLDTIIENQNSLTDITPFTETTGEEIEISLSSKISAIPIVTALNSASVSFSNANCSMPSGNFKIMNKTIDYSFQTVCDAVNDVSTILGAMMMFIYTFIAIRVLISA